MGTIDASKLTAGGVVTRTVLGWFRANLHSHVREYGGTFATEFTVLACQLLTYKLAAHFLGKDGFSEYAVARRTISMIYLVPLLGITVALPRYIAHAIGGGHGRRTAKYFGAALWCVGSALLASVLLMNLFSGTFAYLFFADKQYAGLVLPLSVLVVGLALHSLVYSYFRGHLEMRRANLLQLVNLGIMPLAAFFLFGGSVRSVLLSLGILATAGACVGLAMTPVSHAGVHVVPEAKELLRYGVQRVPGDFALMALFTLPATFVAHFRGVQEAGYVAFGISVLNMVGTAFTPIGSILLPRAGRMFASGERRELREYVWGLTKLTVGCSGLMAAALFVVAPRLIHFYLGPNFSEVASITRVVLLGGVPYCLYLVLRNILDAFHEAAITSLFLGAALAVLAVGTALVNPWLNPSFGTVTALLAA
ncbi:MAG TPA: lipopolysaccharide biosynthesis protein, partial [Candidatus Acidoferrum sp.]|nr:lipopolysaccharide biosynthesis protein [Candidatus Acidoferrum sp.]